MTYFFPFGPDTWNPKGVNSETPSLLSTGWLVNVSHLAVHLATNRNGFFEQSRGLEVIGTMATKSIHHRHLGFLVWRNKKNISRCFFCLRHPPKKSSSFDDIFLEPTVGGNSNIYHFHPEIWGTWSNLTHIFQMGWNHQLGSPWKKIWHENLLKWLRCRMLGKSLVQTGGVLEIYLEDGNLPLDVSG